MRKITILASIACVGLLAGSAVAAPLIPWANPSGSAQDFNYSGGGSDFGLFGEPTIVGNSFFFFPAQFRAEATNGGSDVVNDRLEITIDWVNPEVTPTGVIISEVGEYTMNGSGSVSITGQLNLTNLLVPFPPQVRTDQLDLAPSSFISGSNINDQWTGQAGVDLSGESIGWTRFRMVLSNELSAIADDGSTVSVEKLFAGGAVVVTVVPEPATAALLLAGAAGLLARRRR